VPVLVSIIVDTMRRAHGRHQTGLMQRSRYANGAVPNPVPPSRPKLRLVK